MDNMVEFFPAGNLTTVKRGSTLFFNLNSGNTPNLNCQSSMNALTPLAILDQYGRAQNDGVCRK